LERLLKTGRWNNKSEVFRYGLELVAREVDEQDLSPLPFQDGANAIKAMSAEELAEERALARATSRPR